MEAGPHTRDVPDHIQPARFYSILSRPAETFTFHVGKPSPALRDRSIIVPTGRALGGGSSVNCMEVIFVVNDETKVVLGTFKPFSIQGRQPQTMTIGKRCMGIKDGVLNI